MTTIAKKMKNMAKPNTNTVNVAATIFAANFNLFQFSWTGPDSSFGDSYGFGSIPTILPVRV